MLKVYLLLLGLFIQFSFLQAQKLELLDSLSAPPIIDSLFIDRDIANYSLRGFVSFKNQRFQITDDINKVKFSPNNPGGIGFGFANEKVIVDIAFNLNLKEKEPTSRFDLGVNFKQGSNYFDFLFQRYEGFNVESNNSDPYFRQDIFSLFSGIKYLYLLNNKNYDLGALRSVITNRNKTAYSIGVGGFGLLINHGGDSTLINTYPDDKLDNQNINNLFGIGIGPLIGLSGFFDIGYNFYTTIGLSTGAGLMYKEISNDSGIYVPNRIMIYQLNTTFALGYIRNKYYINLNVRIGFDSTHLYENNTELISQSQAKIAFGYRLFKKE